MVRGWLANNVVAQTEIEAGRMACPFNEVLESKNAFYLVCHDSQAEVGKITAFHQWILVRAASEQETFRFRYGATQPMAPLHGTLTSIIIGIEKCVYVVEW